MTDFLGRVAARTLGRLPTVRPEPVVRFQRGELHDQAPSESRGPDANRPYPADLESGDQQTQVAPGRAVTRERAASRSTPPPAELRSRDSEPPASGTQPAARAAEVQPEVRVAKTLLDETSTREPTRRHRRTARTPAAESEAASVANTPVVRSPSPRRLAEPLPAHGTVETPATLTIEPIEQPAPLARALGERRQERELARRDRPAVDRRRTTPQASPEPTIHVSIGRVEIQAVPSAPPQSPRVSSWSRGPMQSLEEYQERRRKERG